MLKRKLEADKGKEVEPLNKNALKKQRKKDARDLSKYINKQRTLIFSSRGINFKFRHFMKDLQDLLPHSKKDCKLDTKDKLQIINEVAEMKNCNNTIFFESRKHKDLYMWMSKTPMGPSVKFLCENIHTMAEVKLTGNCLKGSRPILNFDKNFDDQPHLKLLKELMTQIFGSPKGHPKVKPFIDHVLSFFYADGRIWVRNYQVMFDVANPTNPNETSKTPVLVEIGPRFVLNPIRIFGGSFGGPTLWENPKYVSPNKLRAELKLQRSMKYKNRVAQEGDRQARAEANPMPQDELEGVFADKPVKKKEESSSDDDSSDDEE